MATFASIEPVAASNTQSPPRTAEPVRSSDATTSAPVAFAIAEINAAPADPSATLQP
ncbi:MAG: hypothetical protein Q7U57_13455 [Methylovulum sp.]|nr:hypothetical protein [Methylovulum sp.]